MKSQMKPDTQEEEQIIVLPPMNVYEVYRTPTTPEEFMEVNNPNQPFTGLCKEAITAHYVEVDKGDAMFFEMVTTGFKQKPVSSKFLRYVHGVKDVRVTGQVAQTEPSRLIL